MMVGWFRFQVTTYIRNVFCSSRVSAGKGHGLRRVVLFHSMHDGLLFCCTSLSTMWTLSSCHCLVVRAILVIAAFYGRSIDTIKFGLLALWKIQNYFFLWENSNWCFFFVNCWFKLPQSEKHANLKSQTTEDKEGEGKEKQLISCSYEIATKVTKSSLYMSAYSLLLL